MFCVNILPYCLWKPARRNRYQKQYCIQNIYGYMGEPPASNYLKPELIKELVQYVNGIIVVIMDEKYSVTIPVEGETRLKENYIDKNL